MIDRIPPVSISCVPLGKLHQLLSQVAAQALPLPSVPAPMSRGRWPFEGRQDRVVEPTNGCSGPEGGFWARGEAAREVGEDLGCWGCLRPLVPVALGLSQNVMRSIVSKKKLESRWRQ